MTRRERLIVSRKKAKLSQAALAEKMGVKQPYIAAIEKSGEFSYKQACVLAEILGVDENWLFFDISESIPVEAEEGDTSMGQEPDPSYGNQQGDNARLIGGLPENNSNTKFTEISPGRYRMKVDLVPYQARAGYLSGFGDHPYIEELPKHEVTVTKYHSGKYLAFEVSGDSMNDGSIKSIPDGSIITGRILDKQLWRPKLHTHNYDYWIFVHKYEGILVKMIKEQNAETGDITLASLNPNKELYPDQVINLIDVHEILNVVKIEMEV